nr:beta-defensin [Quasipaa spinosa]
MNSLTVLFLVLVAVTWTGGDGASPLIWGCENFLGYCRLACFARESSVGQKECAEGMLCCIPNVFGTFW